MFLVLRCACAFGIILILFLSLFLHFGHSNFCPLILFKCLDSVRNSIYSSMPISLKLYQLFCYGLKMCITETRLFKYVENVTSKKLKIFRHKISNIFHNFAQNIDCGYSLEPPRRGGSNEYPQSMFLSRNKKNNVYP